MSKLVVVIGATGLQGGSVLKTLYASAKYKLRAISRNPDSCIAKNMSEAYPGVEWMTADMNDLLSLRKAFAGADIVFGMTNFFEQDILAKVAKGDMDAEFTQGKNIVDAAIAEGVESLIYSGLDSMKQLSDGKYTDVVHFEGKYKIEEYLLTKAHCIKGYVIYLGSYMQNYTNPNFTRISIDDMQTIEFAFPYSPTTLLPLVDPASDTGPVVEYILDHPSDCLGFPIEVSGGYYEAQEMAAAYSKVTGKPARYVQTSYESAGSEDFIQMFKGISEFGLFGGRSEFIDRNKKMDYKFVTPTQFWKSEMWAGPSK
ncbi:hypothetical protein H4R24_003769 [Coemansia sp. RSA 988]|nr:hypothetical protein H4R24_003769 [Coemansia sp. RSA 988]